MSRGRRREETYEERRNRLIPVAEGVANKEVIPEMFLGVVKSAREEAYRMAWNKAFHRAMDRLWREREGSRGEG